MPLTTDQLRLVGIKSYLNADDLLKDAEILFDNQRWARTLYLCCIADEELAKSLLSLSAAIKSRLGEFDTEKEQHFRQRFYTHRLKTGTLHAVEAFFFSKRTMTDIVQMLNPKTC
jgi:AbiV family abortive infection protein